MSFGERLSQLRIEKGYSTRKSFAEKLNIPETTLRNYETDAREPGHTFLKQISDFFNVSCDYLLCLTDEQEKMKSHNLKSSEYSMVEKYRELDSHGKKMVDFTLNEEWERSTSETKVVPMNVKQDTDYLFVKAAHNDAEITDEELKKMERDSALIVEMAKKKKQ